MGPDESNSIKPKPKSMMTKESAANQGLSYVLIGTNEASEMTLMPLTGMHNAASLGHFNAQFDSCPAINSGLVIADLRKSCQK